MDKNFSKDKVAVITGGAKKIGSPTGRELADRELNVLIHTREKNDVESKKTPEKIQVRLVNYNGVDAER